MKFELGETEQMAFNFGLKVNIKVRITEIKRGPRPSFYYFKLDYNLSVIPNVPPVAFPPPNSK